LIELSGIHGKSWKFSGNISFLYTHAYHDACGRLTWCNRRLKRAEKANKQAGKLSVGILGWLVPNTLQSDDHEMGEIVAGSHAHEDCSPYSYIGTSHLGERVSLKYQRGRVFPQKIAKI
jgi:hypothetical protein